MLFVKTRLGESLLHGIGLFADEFIARHTVLWKFTPGFDLRWRTTRECRSLTDCLAGNSGYP